MNNRLASLQAKIAEAGPLQESDRKEFASLCDTPVMCRLLHSLGEIGEAISTQLLGVDFTSPSGAIQAAALQARARAYMAVIDEILTFATTEPEGESNNG